MKMTNILTCQIMFVVVASTCNRIGTAAFTSAARNAFKSSSVFSTEKAFLNSLNKNILSHDVRLQSSAQPAEQASTETELKIVSYPHPALRAKNEDITKEELESGEFAKIAKEMFSLMYATKGVGLAAPQVGINKRMFVYNQTGDPKKWLDEVIVINPKITSFSEAQSVENEGCLSFPDMRGEVQRSKSIKVQMMNLKGKRMKMKYRGWEARIFQHEYDHIEGILYPDRMTEEGKAEVQPRINDLIDEFGEGGTL